MYIHALRLSNTHRCHQTIHYNSYSHTVGKGDSESRMSEVCLVWRQDLIGLEPLSCERTDGSVPAALVVGCHSIGVADKRGLTKREVADRAGAACVCACTSMRVQDAEK